MKAKTIVKRLWFTLVSLILGLPAILYVIAKEGVPELYREDSVKAKAVVKCVLYALTSLTLGYVLAVRESITDTWSGGSDDTDWRIYK